MHGAHSVCLSHRLAHVSCQEAAAGGARARKIERDQIAHLQRLYAAAQSQASSVSQQNVKLETQLAETLGVDPQVPQKKRGITRVGEQIVRPFSDACPCRSCALQSHASVGLCSAETQALQQ